MCSAIEVCDCFFDVGVYCKMKDSSYKQCFSLYMKDKNDRKTSFMTTTHVLLSVVRIF